MNTRDFFETIEDWRPAPSNFFEVSILETDLKGSTLQPYYSILHCKSFSFPEYGLTFERDKGTLQFALTKYDYLDSVSITWEESSSYDVKKFHEEWSDIFFDKNSGLYKSGNPGKRKKTFFIHLQTPNKEDQRYHKLRLVVLPPKLPSLSGEWGKESGVEYTFTYPVFEWEWSQEDAE